MDSQIIPAKPVTTPKKKRRGNPQVYRDYMRVFMRKWRAERKIKPPEKHGHPD